MQQKIKDIDLIDWILAALYPALLVLFLQFLDLKPKGINLVFGAASLIIALIGIYNYAFCVIIYTKRKIYFEFGMALLFCFILGYFRYENIAVAYLCANYFFLVSCEAPKGE